jgi:hypothetical protein
MQRQKSEQEGLPSGVLSPKTGRKLIAEMLTVLYPPLTDEECAVGFIVSNPLVPNSERRSYRPWHFETNESIAEKLKDIRLLDISGYVL